MKVDLRSPHSIIDKFVSLLAISHRINSEKDFDELLNLITAEAAKLVDAERATIFLARQGNRSVVGQDRPWHVGHDTI